MHPKMIAVTLLLVFALSPARPAASTPVFWYPVAYPVIAPENIAIDSTLHHGADYFAIDFLPPPSPIHQKFGIYPTLPGVVVYAGCGQPLYGCVIAIRHQDDAKWDKKYYSIYAHLEPGSITVKVGDQVVPTHRIAYMGMSGSGGNHQVHLHFAVRTSDYALSGFLALYGQYGPYVFTDPFDVRPYLWYQVSTRMDTPWGTLLHGR